MRKGYRIARMYLGSLLIRRPYIYVIDARALVPDGRGRELLFYCRYKDYAKLVEMI